MIITVAGNISIPITGRHKEIVDKYNISFNEDDTLESVRAHLSDVRKQHRQLRRVYDTSNRNAVTSIHQTASKSGGVVTNLTFDDVSSIWKATMSIDETNEDDVVVGRKYTIHKKVDQSLKSCLLEKTLLEHRLKAKVQILEDVYKRQLKVMLIEYGFEDLEDHLLHKYLKKSQWCLEGAKEKAVSGLSSANPVM
jgi:hypothetical protein